MSSVTFGLAAFFLGAMLLSMNSAAPPAGAYSLLLRYATELVRKTIYATVMFVCLLVACSSGTCCEPFQVFERDRALTMYTLVIPVRLQYTHLF
jgi:hypothetical protein